LPLKLLVPLKDIQPALADGLVLDHPPRCSRCGAEPAEHFETHNLRLKAGRKRMGLYRQQYRFNQPYRLRIRVCETCYRADFVGFSEEFEGDQTPLGVLARTYSRLFTIGAVVACAGMLLMTNLVPADSTLGGVKSYWPYFIVAGGAVILGVWLHQRNTLRKLRDSLEAVNQEPAQCPRANVRTPVLDNLEDPRSIALEINLKNEEWARECAAHKQWATENYETKTYLGEE
jgi:hypothetical protein